MSNGKMKAEEIQCSYFHGIKQSGYSEESSVFLVIQLLDSQSLERLALSVGYRVVIAQHFCFGVYKRKPTSLSLSLSLFPPLAAQNTNPITRFSWVQKVGGANCGFGLQFPVAPVRLHALSARDGNRNGFLHFPGSPFPWEENKAQRGAWLRASQQALSKAKTRTPGSFNS